MSREKTRLVHVAMKGTTACASWKTGRRVGPATTAGWGGRSSSVRRRGAARREDGRLHDARAGTVRAAEARAGRGVRAVALLAAVGNPVAARRKATVGGVAAAGVDDRMRGGAEMLLGGRPRDTVD